MAKKAAKVTKFKKLSARKPETFAKLAAMPDSNGHFLVAAIGASAGGIEAFTELMQNLAPDTGIAFVFIQHLDPSHESLITELIGRQTKMRVAEVTDGMEFEPNHVYVIPPNTTMSIADGALRLGPRETNRVPMPIDHFMRSLAEQKGNRAIGVILSGSGTDGTLGMAEIQAHGGVTFAQDGSAKYDNMPRSAITQGCVDYVLPPKAIARELARVARHPYIAREAEPTSELFPTDHSGLGMIFQLLRRNTGVDFSHYRQTTILRRIQRRMVVHKIDKLRDYVRYVQTNPPETKALYQDMLINVTSFFRNPGVFEALKSEVFPQILKRRASDAAIRVWTSGCASGEETYSIAIALLEFLGDRVNQIPTQFFGTDVSEASVAKARSGLYPENIEGDVSSERLRRFFTKAEGGYRISKKIRDMCIFAQHNVLSDPPFSQMDIICCRNLLIYLEPVLQSKVISLFHYAMRPNGYLVLGTSEGVGMLTKLFAIADRAHKIFSKKPSASRQVVTFSLNHQIDADDPRHAPVPMKSSVTHWNHTEAQKEFDRRLLLQFSPAAVFINEDMEIVHTRGNINRYFKLAPGRASLSITKMARDGLLYDLRSSVERAKKENVVVRKKNVQIKLGNGGENGRSAASEETTHRVNFEVVPMNIGTLKELFFMILFHDAPVEAAPTKAAVRKRASRDTKWDSSRVANLEQELAATKEYLQSVIETHEATNEELQSANEEILSSNEELQSTNEELETAKEELQSTNEELTTVNDELRSRNLEVTQINNDLTNLFASIDIAVVMVGSDLSIRRFTPRAEKLLGIIAGDIGRPLPNINPTIPIPDFHQMVWQVISTSRPAEKAVRDSKGGEFQLRILPYRTTEGKVDGAVLSFMEMSPRRAFLQGLTD
jgi:two-component system CheB/CheR fusion protein